MRLFKLFIIPSALLILNTAYTCAQYTGYAVNLIPDGLKKGAASVVRFSEIKMEVRNAGSAIYSERKVITILSESAAEQGMLSVSYNSNRDRVSKIEMKIFDDSGKLLRLVKSSEIEDVAIVQSSTFINDARSKICKLKAVKVPYTVDIYYEKTMDGLINYPDWIPQNSYRMSIEKASLIIILPSDQPLRYLSQHYEGEPEIRNIKNSKIYQWQIVNQPARRSEPFAPYLTKVVPAVFTAPADFMIEKQAGNMSSWKDYGQWIYNLNKGRNDLDEQTFQLLRNHTESTPDTIEMIRMLYKYMQNRTRYLNVSLGIGGWQPIPASVVHKNGYGDCKALVNYMKNILEAVSVNSYYTLVYSGNEPYNLPGDFSSNRFNHVILCIPLSNDTVWLECTSQTMPFGYVGRSNADRLALLITSEGGIPVRTPRYKIDHNTLKSNTSVLINTNGTAEVLSRKVFSGTQYEEVSELIFKNKSDQIKSLYSTHNLPLIQIEDIQYELIDRAVPLAVELIKFSVPNYASSSGNRMFLELNMLNKRSLVQQNQEERLCDVEFRSSYRDVDTVCYTIPEGYSVEYLPPGFSLDTDFGKFSINCELKGNIIQYVRYHEMEKLYLEAASFPSFLDFMNGIAKADTYKAVLIKN